MTPGPDFTARRLLVPVLLCLAPIPLLALFHLELFSTHLGFTLAVWAPWALATLTIAWKLGYVGEPPSINLNAQHTYDLMAAIWCATIPFTWDHDLVPTSIILIVFCALWYGRYFVLHRAWRRGEDLDLLFSNPRVHGETALLLLCCAPLVALLARLSTDSVFWLLTVVLGVIGLFDLACAAVFSFLHRHSLAREENC